MRFHFKRLLNLPHQLFAPIARGWKQQDPPPAKAEKGISSTSDNEGAGKKLPPLIVPPDFDWHVERPVRSDRATAVALLAQDTQVFWAEELNLIPLTGELVRPENISKHRVDLLLVESDAIERSLIEGQDTCDHSGTLTLDLESTLTQCRELQIPTVLLCQSMPTDANGLERWIRSFDWVFGATPQVTAACRELSSGDNVNLLPIAIQPRVHNPSRRPKKESRQIALLLGGAKFENTPQSPSIDAVLTEARDQQRLRVFSEAAGSSLDEQITLGDLPLEVTKIAASSEMIEQVYKANAGLIAGNGEAADRSISRRCLEAMACGTPIWFSNPTSWNERVGAPDLDEAMNSSEVMSDLFQISELDWLRASVRSMRAAHLSHTYGHRVGQVMRHLHKPQFAHDRLDSVTAICVSKRPHFTGQIARYLYEQTLPPSEVIFVCHGTMFDEGEIRDAFGGKVALKILHLDGDAYLADGLNLAIEHASSRYLAKIDDDDFYGANYFLDSMLAFGYSQAALVGKCATLCYIESTDQLAIRFPKHVLSYERRVAGGTLIWDQEATKAIRFTRVRQGTDSQFIKSLTDSTLPIYSSDPFNYVHFRYADANEHTWKISDSEFTEKTTLLQKGLDYQFVQA